MQTSDRHTFVPYVHGIHVHTDLYKHIYNLTLDTLTLAGMQSDPSAV
jgi:hypothetical protein